MGRLARLPREMRGSRAGADTPGCVSKRFPGQGCSARPCAVALTRDDQAGLQALPAKGDCSIQLLRPVGDYLDQKRCGR